MVVERQQVGIDVVGGRSGTTSVAATTSSRTIVGSINALRGVVGDVVFIVMSVICLMISLNINILISSFLHGHAQAGQSPMLCAR